MKNSFYALLLPTLILIACENSDNIDLPNYVLSSETTYLHASQGIDTVTLYYTYNQGKLILTEDYTNNAKQPSTHEFFYDMNDRLLNSHMVTYGRFDTKFQETFYSYVYNEEGKIASQIMDSLIQYFGGPITVTIPDQEDYQYDDQLRLISIHWHSEDEGRLRKFFYDGQSNLVKEEVFTNDEDTEPSLVKEYKNFDTHPNPRYSFMQKNSIPFYELGYSYSAHNVLEEEVIDFRTSQENTHSYEMNTVTHMIYL